MVHQHHGWDGVNRFAALVFFPLGVTFKDTVTSPVAAQQPIPKYFLYVNLQELTIYFIAHYPLTL
jgi:hypothetical protein